MHPELGRIAPDEVSNRVQHRERANHTTNKKYVIQYRN